MVAIHSRGGRNSPQGLRFSSGDCPRAGGLLRGQRLVLLVLGDQQAQIPAGGFGLAPPGLPHAFRLGAPGSRLLLIMPAAAGHEQMFAELGEPAPSHTLPPAPTGCRPEDLTNSPS
jgi:hypothetical protein